MSHIRLQRQAAVIIRTAVTYLVSVSIVTSSVTAFGAEEARKYPSPQEMVARPASTSESRPGEILAEIPVGAGSDGEGKKLPSQLGRELLEASKQNVSQLTKLGQHPAMLAGSAKRSLVHLPASQTMFVAVMAGMNWYNIAHALEADPLAWQRTISDPWTATGLVGFYGLMAMQGYAQGALDLHFPGKDGKPNPHRKALFNSLAMGVGMGFSIYLSNVMTDPNVALCGQLMFGALHVPRALSESEAKAELQRRRTKLFERYGVDIKTEPCDKAYEHLIIGQKLWEMAPQLASVMTTALILAYGQDQVLARIAASTAQARATAGRVVVKWALELAPVFVNPAVGVPRIAISAAMKVKPLASFVAATAKNAVHLAAFIYIDHALNPYIVGSINSLSEGVRITNVAAEIQNGILEMAEKDKWAFDQAEFKTNDLDEDCVAQFEAERKIVEKYEIKDAQQEAEPMTVEQKCARLNSSMRLLSSKMMEWRKRVLSKPLTAYQTWEDFLQKFLALQSGSYFFYRKFIEKKVETDNGAFDVLKDNFGTFGLRRKDGAGKSPSEYLENPELVKAEQVAWAQEVAKRYLAKKDKHKSLQFGAARHVLEHLASGNFDRVLKGIAGVRWLKTYPGSPKTFAGIPELDIPASPDAISERKVDPTVFYGDQTFVAYQVWDELGEPSLPVEPGRGAVYIIREIETARDTFNKMEDGIVNLVPFMAKYNSFGEFGKKTSENQKYAVSHLVDKLLVQMACGTDPVKEATPLANWSEGWRAEFYPPSIVDGAPELRKQLCAGLDREDVSGLYTKEVTVNGKKYKGVIDAIRGNLRKELDTPEKFDVWWEAFVIPKLEPTFEKFSYSYNGIVKQLHDSLQGNPSAAESVQAFFNLTDAVSDSAIDSLEQELKYNLAILGDIYIAALKKKTGAELPRALFALPQKQPATKWCFGTKCSRFAAMKTSGHMSLRTPKDAQGKEMYFSASYDAPVEYSNLQFQEEVLKAFRELRGELRKVKWTVVDRDGMKVEMLKLGTSKSELFKKMDQFEVLLDNEVSIPLGLPEALSDDDASTRQNGKRLDAQRRDPKYFVQIKNPVLRATAQFARDNAQSVLFELRNYVTVLSMSAIGMGDKQLEGN